MCLRDSQSCNLSSLSFRIPILQSSFDERHLYPMTDRAESPLLDHCQQPVKFLLRYGHADLDTLLLAPWTTAGQSPISIMVGYQWIDWPSYLLYICQFLSDNGGGSHGRSG